MNLNQHSNGLFIIQMDKRQIYNYLFDIEDPEEQDECVYDFQSGGPMGHLKFYKMGKEQKRVVTLGSFDPKYLHRCIDVGVTLIGKCENPKCKVRGKVVMIHKGFGKFSLSQQIHNSYCPICKQEVPPETISNLGYMNCSIKVQGKRINEKTKYQWKDTQNKGKFVYFKEYNNERKPQWAFLTITATKI